MLPKSKSGFPKCLCPKDVRELDRARKSGQVQASGPAPDPTEPDPRVGPPHLSSMAQVAPDSGPSGHDMAVFLRSLATLIGRSRPSPAPSLGVLAGDGHPMLH